MERLSRDEVSIALQIAAPDLERIEHILVNASKGGTPLLSESAAYLAQAGGKRVRPALVVLAAMLGKGASEAVHLTAAAVEMTHLATLYHDDVIDEAALRRGVPSVNKKWGNTLAILAGDYLFAKASRLAAEVGGEVPEVLAEAIARVVAGQVRELESTFDSTRTPDRYIETIGEKTAALIEASARLGAVLGETAKPVVESLAAFGSNFGYAFQIADDLLDLSATEEELGKPPGTDLRDGVYTLPVIYAIQADPGIAGLLGGRDPDVDAIRGAVLQSGGFERAKSLAAQYADRALTDLDQVPQAMARESLEQLARLIVQRVPALEV